MRPEVSMPSDEPKDCKASEHIVATINGRTIRPTSLLVSVPGPCGTEVPVLRVDADGKTTTYPSDRN